jgi:hypothetical protein
MWTDTMTNDEVLNEVGPLVGTEYSERLRLAIAEKIGRAVRPYGNFLVSQDHQAGRLNIRVNEDGIISGFLFG